MMKALKLDSPIFQSSKPGCFLTRMEWPTESC